MFIQMEFIVWRKQHKRANCVINVLMRKKVTWRFRWIWWILNESWRDRERESRFVWEKKGLNEIKQRTKKNSENMFWGYLIVKVGLVK